MDVRNSTIVLGIGVPQVQVGPDVGRGGIVIIAATCLRDWIAGIANATFGDFIIVGPRFDPES